MTQRDIDKVRALSSEDTTVCPHVPIHHMVTKKQKRVIQEDKLLLLYICSASWVGGGGDGHLKIWFALRTFGDRIYSSTGRRKCHDEGMHYKSGSGAAGATTKLTDFLAGSRDSTTAVCINAAEERNARMTWRKRGGEKGGGG